MSAAETPSKTALVAIADGSEEIEAVCVIDVLVRAGVDVTVASVMPTVQVTASRGVKLVADAAIVDCVGKDYDVIYAPGGLPGAQHLADSEEFMTIVKAQIEKGGLVTAICAAPAVTLGELLNDVTATAHPNFTDKLAKPSTDRVVRDGNFITSRGPGTAIELGIAIVTALFDVEKGLSVGRPMVMDEASLFRAVGLPAVDGAFHLAIPVHDLEASRPFYGGILGLEEGRSSDRWVDYSLFGHQLVTHCVGADFKAQDHFNPVDGDDVPVPHFGVCLTTEAFDALADKLTAAGVEFVIPPTVRFVGAPGEQKTMFFKDPSNNNLEFKAMATSENLFARYHVEGH